MRCVIAFVAGGIFGAGLLISGTTDTTKVQGWLDIFGDWDPTLAFVMGGAIIPMAIVWRFSTRRKSFVGRAFPPHTDAKPDKNLIIGSTLSGMGWGLAGLCPGPAMASLGFGGPGAVLFLVAMMAGMMVAPGIRSRVDARTAAV